MRLKIVRIVLPALLWLFPIALHAESGFVETSFNAIESEDIETDGNIISGSAPLDLTFTAFPPEEAIYFLWEVSADADFSNVALRYNEMSFSRVFNDYGEYFVRFYCADYSGTKEWTGTTYTVRIFESGLECPNAFTPFGSPGINDEWKVTARSITEFDCIIFNRYGNEIGRLTSVEQGWDGRHRGKPVAPGVYFYVISARGADGRIYKLSGDINLIGKR